MEQQLADIPATSVPTPSSCFLCALDIQPCSTPLIEGKVLGARIEKQDGRTVPLLGLLTSTGQRVSITLGVGHMVTIQRLASISTNNLKSITVRMMHLGRSVISTPPSGGDAFVKLQTLPATLLIVEPDILLNITDLNHVNYCVRQDALRRFFPSSPSAASVKGTLIHTIFKEMLKSEATDPEQLLDAGLHAAVVSLALAATTEQEVHSAALPHLHSLDGWRQQHRAHLWGDTPRIRAETFLLAPEIGLKGRLDILWESGQERRLLELKTGKATGDLPKADHRWQVYGYHALLAARNGNNRQRTPRATLLYSGTPDSASGYGIPTALREVQRVIEMRNELAIMRVTNIVPPPPGEKKCSRCLQRPQCSQISPLLGWEPPVGDGAATIPAEDTLWFQKWFALQMLETRTVEQESHALWKLSLRERIAAGIAIDQVTLIEKHETDHHEWHYRFGCINTSELRDGDEIILSDGDPITGEIVSGSVLSITSTEVTVWAREEIEHPSLIDRYSADITSHRMFANLTRWLHVDEHRRALVRGTAKPRFEIDPPPIMPMVMSGLNSEQATAVMRALTMKDYLLIQGPPGTGKTKVIAAITRALLQRGYRVGLAAYTNQATDTMLTKIIESDITNVVRLGHEVATAPAMRPYRLIARATTAEHPVPLADDVRHVLKSVPVVAATVTTWASEEYEVDRSMPLFDVMIIDEATQLTTPAALGALRWGRRFILVGDEHQLPPLVQSEAAKANGLGTSLFETLVKTASTDACIRLRRQYRMHADICAFPSQQFYADALVADGSVATQTLNVAIDNQSLLLQPDYPLLWCDVPPLPTLVPKLNDAEAKVAAQLAQQFVALGLKPEQIGIIAPFRSQVARIRQYAQSLNEGGMTVDTVDRFQGGERDVIILSLVAAESVTAGSPLATFLNDSRRLNVALTRARQKLIILGHASALTSLPLLQALVEHCRTRNIFIQWEEKN